MPTLEEREAIIAEHAIAIEEAQIEPVKALLADLGKAGATALINALETAQPLLRDQRQQQVANALVALRNLPQFLSEDLLRLETAKAARAAPAA